MLVTLLLGSIEWMKREMFEAPGETCQRQRLWPRDSASVYDIENHQRLNPYSRRSPLSSWVVTVIVRKRTTNNWNEQGGKKKNRSVGHCRSIRVRVTRAHCQWPRFAFNATNSTVINLIIAVPRTAWMFLSAGTRPGRRLERLSVTIGCLE